MNYTIIIYGFIWFITSITSSNYATNLVPSFSNPSNKDSLHTSPWQQLDTGLYFGEFQAPFITEVGDYKVQILKIDPHYYSFDFVLASQNDSCRLTAPEWAWKNQMIGVINAGMYNMQNKVTATGYLQNLNHINQGEFKAGFRMMAAFNPVRNDLPEFNILDLELNDWNQLRNEYQSYCQSIRMIDANGQAVYWNPKRKMRMSVAVLGMDKDGNVLFMFSRSPFSANEFIDFMLALPFKVQSAMYLEGGPQASLFIEHNQFCLDKMGSYVSPGYAHDRNDHFWDIPNVIGFRKKTTVSP